MYLQSRHLDGLRAQSLRIISRQHCAVRQVGHVSGCMPDVDGQHQTASLLGVLYCNPFAAVAPSQVLVSTCEQAMFDLLAKERAEQAS